MTENGAECVYLLYKGDQTDLIKQENDNYLEEFNKRQLISTIVPILDVRYKDLDILRNILINFDDEESNKSNGLIISSPRVVEAIARALEPVKISKLLKKRFNPDLIFVIGQKSGQECFRKLGLDYNTDSTQTGSAQAMIDYVIKFCRENHLQDLSKINLLYPKGSLSDYLIENALAASKTNIQINSLIVYETNVIENIAEASIEGLKKVISSESSRAPKLLSINIIFFSPSGVEGFKKMMMSQEFTKLLKSTFSNREIHLSYSAIGETTKGALLKNGFKVYCVSNKPNPASLVDSLLSSS